MADGGVRMDLTERIVHLRNFPVASMLRPQLLHMMARYVHERHYASGELLVKEGDMLSSMHLIVSGRVRVGRGESFVRELGAPETVGFLGALAPDTSPFRAEALTDVIILELDGDALNELLEDHFSLLHACIRLVNSRLVTFMSSSPAAQLSIPAIPGIDPPPADRPLDLVERIFFLRKMSFFGSANLNVLAAISEGLVEERYPAGRRLWSEGDTPDQIYFLVAGQLRGSTESGKEFVYGAGTVIGGIESMAQQPRWYTLTTNTDVVLLSGAHSILLDMMEENATMARDFLAFLTGVLRGIMQRRFNSGQAPAPPT